MRYMALFWLVFAPVALSSDEEDPSQFIAAFAADFKGHKEAAAFDQYFVGAPVFFLGEQPGISSAPDFAPGMVELLRETLHLDQYPFGKVKVESQNIADDGTATLLVVFERERSREPYAKAICNIFALTKTQGGWKISFWHLVTTYHPTRCTWA
ncbi:hypothetical protein AUP74_01858 [Microbulbifer aggregans]|uniref:SnoaL-like domain-containing protein n=1 Tax=Microbulbifer aggregans TaxID=1769779 RepID=A0A1C9W800_9GAMM|nr:hypothetical protein [Microbulbifer aggregans]AOS97289.1 hypothetical protein AUP74_01858 [Microbulbifer aggregans]